jgi:predicted naringenin-chalcone synthase
LDYVRDAVLGLGTALPAHVLDQNDAALAISDWLESDSKLIRRLFRLSGVARRHTCVDGFRPDLPGPLFVHPAPSTGARMELYAHHAPPLAAEAARKALQSAGIGAAEIDHVVVVSCTGFVAPGPDVALIGLLGLRRSVERTIVGFMGCHAAFNGLRVARAAARDGRTVLMVCVELCSLHAQPEDSRDALVSSSLFGDGAAAVVVGRESEARPALIRPGRAESRLEPDGGEHMAWQIGDTGFRMRLSAYVPQLLGADVASFVTRIAGGADVNSWCVHPGGPAILARIESALGLPDRGLITARAALRDHGNLSSATVLFVLERELARLTEGQRGVMLGFGPGLTLEGMAFERGPAQLATAATESAALARDA